ncbi:hypothetical protein [Phycisphaera mikurensis]|uniref:hypothetical protein n=1 Tax=Phycisphaera mikurensis TaxID=547188 RepID=UPI0012B56829|nr:hypothetical protein [Phycisphaera mikurensis]MBB6441848.1 hypothetical protein [Phycisphaera mikurensis]
MPPVPDILLLLLAWAVGCAAVGGWGLAAARAMSLVGVTREEPRAAAPAAAASPPRAGLAGRPPARVARPGGLGLAAWWLGLPPMLLFLQAWHLAMPVGWLAWPAVLAIAAAGYHLGREAAARWLRWGLAHPAVLAATGVAAVALAWRVATPAGPGAPREVAAAWEPLVQLGRQWSLPLGVGNLSAVFGLNHAWTLLAALFSVGPWAGLPGRAASGLVALPLAAAAFAGLAAAAGARRGSGDDRATPLEADERAGALAAGFFDAGAALLLAAWIAGPGLSAPLPGVGAGALLFAATGQAFRGVAPSLCPHRGERIDRLAVAVVLAAGAAAAHPPAWAIAFPLMLWSGWVLLVTDRAALPARRSTRSVGFDHHLLPGALPRKGTVIALAVGVGALAAAWVLRSLWTTGRPLFPFQALSLPVDWAVSRSAVRELGRVLGEPAVLESVLAQAGGVLLPATAGVLAWLLWIARGGAEGRQRRTAPLPLVLAAGLSLSLFEPGPTPGSAVNAAAAAAIAAGGLAALAMGGPRGGRSAGTPHPWLLTGAVLVAAAGVAVAAALTPAAPSASAADPAAPTPPPPPPIAADAGMRPWVSAWGVEAQVPAAEPERAAAAEGLPGFTPLPSAAREPSASLRANDPADPEAGFRLDRRDPRQVRW